MTGALGGASPLLPAGALLLAGALIGGAWGGLVGSLAGLSGATGDDTAALDRTDRHLPR